MQSEDKQTKLLSLKALCNLNPEYVKQFDLKQLLTENNKFRQLIISYVLPILPLTELQEYEDFFLSQPKTKWIYLNLLFKKSCWHCLKLSLDLILEYPTDKNIAFFHKLFYQKTAFYQEISNNLKIVIYDQITRVEKINNSQLKTVCRDIKFILKNV